MPGNNSTKSHLYWNTLLRVPVQVIGIVISILITRTLDPKDFGVMAIVMMLIGYSNLLTNFGFNEAVIQQTIKDKKTLDSIFTIDIAISILMASLFYNFSGDVAVFFDMPETEGAIQVMIIFFLMSSFYALPHTFLRRDMKFMSVSLFDSGTSLATSVFTLVLALSNYGYWALVYGQIIPLIVMTILICIYVKWKPRLYFNKDKMKRVFHFGAWNFTKTQLQFFAAHIDRFIIGKWMDATSLGFYDKAVMLARTPYDSFTMNINSVMFSSFSMQSDNLDVVRSQFKKSIALITYTNFPVYLGLIAIAPCFVSVLLGEKWEPMIGVFQIILAGYLVSSYTGMLSSLIVGIGKYKQLTLLLLAAVILFVVFCAALLKYGLIGIAVSYVLFSVVLVMLWTSLAVMCIDLRPKELFESIIHGVFASVLMFSIVIALSTTILSERTVFNLIAMIAVGATVYMISIMYDKSEMATELKTHIFNDISKLLSRLRKKV